MKENALASGIDSNSRIQSNNNAVGKGLKLSWYLLIFQSDLSLDGVQIGLNPGEMKSLPDRSFDR